MSAVLQQLFLPMAIITYLGVMVILFFRLLHKQRAYLRRLPFMEGVPLDMNVTPPVKVQLAMIRAMFERQDDPEVEQLRRDMWRRFGAVLIWLFGFPLICMGALALLSLLGRLH